MSGFKASLVALALVLVMFSANAAEIEGVKVPDQVKLGDTGPELVLNGAGLRTRAIFKVYVGALYLQQKKTVADAVLADTGARRIALHLLRDLSSEQLLSAFNDGLKSNHAPAELAKLDAQVKQLESIFAAVKEAKTGEVILLDYIPGSGTRVVVNRDTKGTIPGEDFNRALLRIWLGERPVDAALKKAMLGG
jgi:Chalcone isomerase-like